MTNTDFYEILGVSRAATAEEIRAAHRAQSRRHHPDTADNGSGDPAVFARIQEAYDVLANPDSRRDYDQLSAIEHIPSSRPTARRPSKTPCGVCNKPVYPSQLTLYLGRHLCQACHHRKQQRSANRPRLSGMGEFFWQLRCMRVWVQSHFVLVGLILIAGGVAGWRVVRVFNHAHHPIRMDSPATVSDPSDAASSTPALANPSAEPPVNSSGSADAQTPQDGDKR